MIHTRKLDKDGRIMMMVRMMMMMMAMMMMMMMLCCGTHVLAAWAPGCNMMNTGCVSIASGFRMQRLISPCLNPRRRTSALLERNSCLDIFASGAEWLLLSKLQKKGV